MLTFKDAQLVPTLTSVFRTAKQRTVLVNISPSAKTGAPSVIMPAIALVFPS